MSCVLRITDPLLKSILGKEEFKTIDELRVAFDNVANKHSILPLNINPPSKGFDIQKFGKVYKEGDEIKVQIVLPGQEYFSQFNLSNRLPDEMREVSFYGDTDDKTLTFDSLDSFLGFYLANFLYVTDSNYTKISKGVTTILENVVGRLQGKTFKHAGAIEDLLFADSLVNYSKLLYNYAGLEEPPVINQVYELIKDKWDRYHKNEVDQNRVKEKAEQNVQTFVKSDVKANLFFQAFDYVNGKENTKPLAQARRNLIRAIQDPSKYSVKLVQGSVTQAQQTDDNGNYPTIEMIERGVVGILIDENGNQLYLNKNNELTPNREEAISIDYEVDGEKKSSPEITLPFLNVHKALKEEFLKASPQQKETYIFKVENIKTQIEEKTFAEFNEVGKVEDILINIIADDPYAGISYLMKDGKQIIVDSTPLNEEEIEEVIKLLNYEYEDKDVLDKVVAYLNDLISVSDERVRKEKTGKEIAFFAGDGMIWVKPFRIKTEQGYESVDSEGGYYEEEPDLIKQSLRAARVRFRKGEGASLQTSWSKWKIVDGVPKSFSVKREEGIKFYESHIKKVKVDQKTSSQIATFTEKVIPKIDQPIKQFFGALEITDKVYTLGEMQQLAFLPLSNPATGDRDNQLKQKELARKIWGEIYTKSDAKFIFREFEGNYSGSAMSYNPNTKTVTISPSNIKGKSSTYLTNILVEEVLHNVTINRMMDYSNTEEFKRLEQDYEKAKELLNTYQENPEYQKLNDVEKKKVDTIAKYCTQNIEEFIAGISNPTFRWFLKLGESRDKNLLEKVIDSIKNFLNIVLKGEAPSLYTDVTTDLFNFISKKPSELTPFAIEQTQISTAPELPQVPLKKREKKSTENKEIKKFYAAPDQEEIDLTLIQGIDAEIGKTLFNSGVFADFVQKNVETESVWQRMVNDLKEEYNELIDAPSTQENEERLDWIDLFLENEMEYKRHWIEKSNLFLFNNDKMVINEDEIGLEEEESAETSDEIESKDPGYNRVDSEQSKTRLQLGDPYAKILVKLTPVGRVKGLTQLADFTNLWNRLQNLLANTISFDEQIKILSNTDNLVIVPEAPVLVERLESIPKDVNGAIIINNFQRSFGTALIPVYNTYFTKTDRGYDYSFFESAKLDVQNLEMLINQGFNEFAESWKTTVRLGDRDIPTYDLKQFLTFLEKSKDLVETYRQLGFPIPVMDKDRFIREAGLANFHAGLIQIIKNRIGKWNGGDSKNTVILNGDLLTFIKSAATWVEFGNNIGTSPGLPTLTNKFTSALAKYSPLTVSNMTKNAENQNQSILLSWSSWLISVKQLNDGESYRSKNPIFKYSLLSQLVDTDNQITPINLTGQRIQDGTGWEGTVSMSQNFIDYARQEISNMMLSGTGEILRAETKQSSFGYRFKWRRESNNMHPVMLENFKTDKWVSDVSDIYIGNKNEDVLKGYLKGELERIEIEKNNPVVYYPKYDKIKEDFHLFTFLSKELKENLTSLSPQEAVDKYRNEIKKELLDHFNNLVNELKQEVFNQTGLPLTANHPVLNVTQIQEKIKELGFDNFLKAFIVNRDIYQTEHFITGHGDIGQHDKPYKRFGSNISTGTPVAINEITNEVLENTKHKQFRERIPTGRSFVINDDIYSYDNPKLVDDIEKSLTESYKRFGLDKTPQEIREEAVKKASKYLKTNVADGQGFMTPDFGRLVMIATGTWTHDREKGFWFQKIQHKRNKGVPLTIEEQNHYNKVNEEIKERGIFWFFPPLKLQYRGEFIPNNETNVAIEGLDKFSLAWLWPDEMEGRVFEPILNKMMDEGYDYGKFESGTKIGTFKPDNLLQEIRNGNIDVTIESGHNIDLTYMKEQVRAADKFKDKMPMSTQARKLVLSNLRFNGEYLSESIGEAATEWKQSQAEISEENVLDLMDKISTDGQIDNKKLADEIKEELKKRELPQSLTSIFTLYGDEFYQRFEQSLSPQLVETLIYSLLKNKVVRPKFPGEHYIMMSSSLFDREGRELGFYELGDETKPAQCKVVLSGEFLKLLNVKEITDYINSPEVKPVYDALSPYEQIENKRELLNQLLLNLVFVEKYKESLTVFSSRIPGQGYNSMDVMTVQEFLPTYMGAVLVPYAQMTTKVGADFDFDKIPTITPELTKTGKAKDSKVNRMLNAVSRLILDPINFHRLVTPNTTDEIDQVVANTLEALGENVSEPKFDRIFSFTTHLRKWMATKMKDALGIGATNNTFYTLLQDSDSKLNKKFTIGDGWGGDVKFPFEREDKPMSYPLLQSGIDKLEFVNEFINITVDVASNDAIGYTGLKRDNSAFLLFLLENGVDFADAFYFINQPIIIKYHQLLNQFKDQGYTSTEAKNLSISKLLGITTQIDGGQRVQAQIYGEIDNMIKKDKFSNLLSTIARKDEVDKKWNTANQKEYLAYYLIGLEMANKMREAQTYNNFDTRPSPNLLYSQARENSLEQIRFSGLFDLEEIQKIHNDSVISHLNVHDEFKRISEVAFKIKRDPRFTTQSLGLSEYIYDQNDKENFFKKFDNDYLLAILQNFGTISKEKVEKNLRGELVEKWNKVKKLDEVKDLTISKYIVTNYSTKTPYTSLTLFLGLDGDSLTLDQIAKDLRVMLNSPNKEVKEFAKDFIETGLYATGFTQSPVYYLKALPFEVVNGYLKEAYDNYEKLSPLEQQRFIGLFSDRFMFQRGMQFGQYWIQIYKKIFGIKNLNFQTKQLKFNQEAWRYTDYKLSLEELNRPESKPVSVTTYQGRITKLGDNEVFVFGSNPLGINGNPSKGTGGAALVAYNIAGVKQGEKMDNKLSDSGKAWGITTVTSPGAKRSKTPEQIKQGIKKLYDHAANNPDKRFLVAYQGTEGKNLNGYSNQELADMFSAFNIPSNVIFEKQFSTLLTQSDMTIQMQEDNIKKILEGTKTSTVRSKDQADKIGIPVGQTRVVNLGGKSFNVTNKGLLSIEEAGGKEAILKSEGISKVEDFKFQQTKDWINGKGKLYVYSISSDMTQPIQSKQLDLFEEQEQKDCDLDIPF